MSDHRRRLDRVGSAGPVPPECHEIAVVGAGSWGTALALHCARAGHRVRLWGHDPRKVDRMAEVRDNEVYLPGFALPAELTVTSSTATALSGAGIVLSAVPSRHLRGVWEGAREHLRPGAHVVSATKGIEEGTGLRMTEVLDELLTDVPASLSAVSGPSFARELAEGHPTAITLGCEDPQAAITVQTALSSGPLRVYRNPDLVGVEVGGALKNVIAIATGIVEGLGLGTNSRAALICRGLKEMTMLAVRMGGRQSTLMGLAGLGDLVLTCTGPLSRNRGLGEEIGRGRTLEEIMAGMDMVAEGVVTVRSARELAHSHGVEMPITEQVYRVLYEGRAPDVTLDELLGRELVDEWPATAEPS